MYYVPTKKDGKPVARVLRADSPFVDREGIHRPKGWLLHATKAEKDYIGVQPWKESTYDKRFFRSAGYTDRSLNGFRERNHTLEPRMSLPELKDRLKEQVKDQADSMLRPTDWMVIRKAETQKAIPAEVRTYRAEVRKASNRIEAEIDSYGAYADLVKFAQNGWADMWPSEDDVTEDAPRNNPRGN